MDCISGKMFRETLLVHPSAKVDRKVDAARLADVRFSGYFRLDQSTANQTKKKFTTAEEKTITSSDPRSLAVFDILSRAYPARFP